MSKPVSVRSGQLEFLKVNASRVEWRDAYQWLLGLTWPQFATFVAAVYIVLNLIFAALFMIGGNSIAGIRPGSFLDSFFFSVQTLATGGHRDHVRSFSPRRHDWPDLRSILATSCAHPVQ